MLSPKKSAALFAVGVALLLATLLLIAGYANQSVEQPATEVPAE